MSLPKVVGLEQEYAITVTPRAGVQPLTQVQAALLLVNSYRRGPSCLWDYGSETPYKSALTRRVSGHPIRVSAEENSLTNNVLANGARYYVDHAHPEYSTPECLSAHDVVACDKAGEEILEWSRQRANDMLGGAQMIHIYKNNSDHKGNSYGCHENYCMEAHTYHRLFRESGVREFIPFLVSRQIMCGAGKVGQENCASPRVGYQISQRADFCESIFSIKTMSGRPLLNARDEPHADRKRFRRLHVILGDANMSEISTYLKVGTTQLVLRMIEDRAITQALTLDNPVQAVRDISLDTSCRAKVRLRDGRRLSAIELQREYLEMAHAYGASHRLSPAEREVLPRWERTLRLLDEEPMQLGRELDWVIKKWLLEEQMARKSLDWGAPRLCQLDIQYHTIERSRSLFYVLQRAGKLERLLDEPTIAYYTSHPTDNTRAYTRGMCLEKYGPSVLAVNWERVCFRPPEHPSSEDRNLKLWLLNPLRGTRAEHESLFAQADTAEAFLQAVSGRGRGRR